MIPMIQMWHSLESILRRKSLFLLPDTENPSRSSLMVLIVVLTFALAVLLVFSTSAYSARNGLTYLLLLLSLILLMAGCLLRLRLWYRLDLICYGCMECMKPLRGLIIM